MIKLTKYELEKVKDFSYMVGVAAGLLIGFLIHIAASTRFIWFGVLLVYVTWWVYLNWSRRKLLG